MDIFVRTKELSRAFSFEKRTRLDDGQLEILPFRFEQTCYENEIRNLQKELLTTNFCPGTDDSIECNTYFNYSVFAPDNKAKFDKAILLLHGLNEKSWDKYLTWAEYLAKSTGRAVILFPIAFHMNRAPKVWCSPREVLPWVALRKEEVRDIKNSTFVNVALSSRISRHPLRFYISGLQSAYNVLQLIQEIKNGEHPLFEKDSSLNIFAYSIGALLSQVLLLANPDKLFTDTKLFVFCGGSIFERMNGCARDILDKDASDKLMEYYTRDFLKQNHSGNTTRGISIEEAFKMMISPGVMTERRENFFQSALNRIHIISLKKDSVIPTDGIVKALGKASRKILEEFDFSFPYSHQIPFPANGKENEYKDLINGAFKNIFDKASAFLC